MSSFFDKFEAVSLNATETTPSNMSEKSSPDSSESVTPDIFKVVSPNNCKRQDYLMWDDYFMATALLTAQRSKDPVTQVGACIVDAQKRIVAIGYNGFPRNCSDDEFPWSKKTNDTMEDKNLYVVHAEANAILNSNCASLVGTYLYTTLFPCNECAKLIIQSGIRNVRYISDKYAHKAKYRASRRMFDAADIIYSKYEPTQNQIVLNFNNI